MFEELSTGRKSAIDAFSFFLLAITLVALTDAFGAMVLLTVSGRALPFSTIVYFLLFIVLPLNSLKDDTERMVVKGAVFTATVFALSFYVHYDVWMLCSALLGLILGIVRPIREYTGY